MTEYTTRQHPEDEVRVQGIKIVRAIDPRETDALGRAREGLA